MKFKTFISGLLAALLVVGLTAPIAMADFTLVGPDGKPVAEGVDEAKIEGGTGEVVSIMALVFFSILAIAVMAMAIAMIMGAREWVKNQAVNIGAGVLLFALGAGGLAGVITAVS